MKLWKRVSSWWHKYIWDDALLRDIEDDQIDPAPHRKTEAESLAEYRQIWEEWRDAVRRQPHAYVSGNCGNCILCGNPVAHVYHGYAGV